MENVFVISAVGTKEASTTASIEGLAARELIVLGTNNVVLEDPADCVGVDAFCLTTKLTSGKFRTSAIIKRRNIVSITKKDYVAAVLPVFRLADGTTGLNVETTGEGEIAVFNKSYNRNINTQRVSSNVTKKTAETPAVYLARVVADLNAQASALSVPFFSAALANSGSNYFINITALTREADISIKCDGMFEGTLITNPTAAVVGNGYGADIVALEKDFSKHLGNQGYEKLTDLWYNAPTEAVASQNYDLLVITWKGESPTASSTMGVGTQSITIAFPTGAAVIDTVETLLRYLSGDTYIDETPVE